MPTHIKPSPSQSAPTEWSGGHLLVGKWLARLCSRESLLELASGLVMLVAGIIALVLTSAIAGGFFFIIILRAHGLVKGFDSAEYHTELRLFILLCALFMIISIFHAYKTRWRTDAVATVDFGSSFSSLTSLALELMSAGPIFVILALRDFQKYLRFARMDTAPVSKLILWLFDKGGRAGFAEISMAFPRLNIVRVLPQLRDVPGVHWWADEGNISLSENLRATLTRLLRRPPAHNPTYGKAPPKPPPFNPPPPDFNDETLSWYAVLNLPPFATLQQVKSRYRQLAKIHHPDARARQNSTPGVSNDDQMKRINEAYHHILDHSRNHAQN